MPATAKIIEKQRAFFATGATLPGQFRREQLHETEPAKGDHDQGPGNAYRHPLGKGDVKLCYVADVLHGKNVCATAGGRGRAADKGAPDNADHESTAKIAFQGLAAATLKDAHTKREQHGGDGHIRDPHGDKSSDSNEGKYDTVGATAYLGEHP